MAEILFCDVDGTLTGTVSGATFKSNPRDVSVLFGVENALARYGFIRLFDSRNQQRRGIRCRSQKT